MSIAQLKAQDFRLYESLAIEPHAELNLVVGENAAGKTSLLEALFVAGRGRSFREGQLGELTRTGAAGWNIFLQCKDDGRPLRIGVGYQNRSTVFRLDGSDARLSEVVRRLPMQLIDPLSHRLLDDGPGYRRSFIDWGVFHVEHRFLSVWRRYQRALKQRNRALKVMAPTREVSVWDTEMAEAGNVVADLRREHVAESQAQLQAWCEKLLGTGEVELIWQQGWPFGTALRDCLKQNLEQHRKMGSTTQGPHRAELRIRFAGERAKGRISRGQQKMLITAMVLAQSSVLTRHGVQRPVLLLDDFSAELAPEFQERLAKGLMDYPGQKFVTSFEVGKAFNGARCKVFHVEQGRIA